MSLFFLNCIFIIGLLEPCVLHIIFLWWHWLMKSSKFQLYTLTIRHIYIYTVWSPLIVGFLSVTTYLTPYTPSLFSLPLPLISECITVSCISFIPSAYTVLFIPFNFIEIGSVSSSNSLPYSLFFSIPCISCKFEVRAKSLLESV